MRSTGWGHPKQASPDVGGRQVSTDVDTQGRQSRMRGQDDLARVGFSHLEKVVEEGHCHGSVDEAGYTGILPRRL